MSKDTCFFKFFEYMNSFCGATDNPLNASKDTLPRIRPRTLCIGHKSTGCKSIQGLVSADMSKARYPWTCLSLHVPMSFYTSKVQCPWMYQRSSTHRCITGPVSLGQHPYPRPQTCLFHPTSHLVNLSLPNNFVLKRVWNQHILTFSSRNWPSVCL